MELSELQVRSDLFIDLCVGLALRQIPGDPTYFTALIPLLSLVHCVEYSLLLGLPVTIYE